jgi:hypothetical protein
MKMYSPSQERNYEGQPRANKPDRKPRLLLRHTRHLPSSKAVTHADFVKRPVLAVIVAKVD